MSVYVYMDCDQMKENAKKGQVESAQTSPNQTVINEQGAAATITNKGEQELKKTCRVRDVIGA